MIPRKRYNTLTEIERYAGTEECAACTKVALEKMGHRTHSHVCR